MEELVYEIMNRCGEERYHIPCIDALFCVVDKMLHSGRFMELNAWYYLFNPKKMPGLYSTSLVALGCPARDKMPMWYSFRDRLYEHLEKTQGIEEADSVMQGFMKYQEDMVW